MKGQPHDKRENRLMQDYRRRGAGMIPKVTITAAERRERRRQRSVRRYEKMLRLMDKPGAERVFPDVEAVKRVFGRDGQLPVTRRPTASRFLGVGKGSEIK
jgi:hypothetical protein